MFASISLPMCLRILQAANPSTSPSPSPLPSPSTSACYATTIAGNGNTGAVTASGNGGPAADAVVLNPTGIAIFSYSGDILIASSTHRVVRIVFAATGTIATFAGRGTAGHSGDGSLAAAAEMRSPDGIVILSDSSVLIADTGSHRVRIVYPNNTIDTWMGNGTAASTGDGLPVHRSQASVNRPWKMTANRNTGDVFIAEYDTGRIRRVHGGSGIVSLLVGPPGSNATVALPLAQPHDVVPLPGSSDAFIVSASSDSRVFLINTASRTAMLVAGTGRTSGFDGNNVAAVTATVALSSGVLFHSASRSVLVADYVNGLLRAFPIGGNISTIAGDGTNGITVFGGPSGLAWLSSGGVLISEYSGNRIRAVSPACLPVTAPVGRKIALRLPVLL